MKQTKILFLLATLPFGAMAQQTFNIEGTVKNVKLPATAYLYYQEDGKTRKDSATVVNEHFVMKGTVSVPMKAFVMLAQGGKRLDSAPNPDQVGIYLENGTVKINTVDSLVKSTVSGTTLNKDQQEMVNAMFGFKKTEINLNSAFKKAEGNEPEIAKIRAEFAAMDKKRNDTRDAFISSHLNSLVALNLLRSSINPLQELPKAESTFNRLSPEVKATKAAAAYKRQMLEAKVLAVGGTAPEFTLKNTNGQDIALSSFKGKYVLIDFWASWCGPCRRENPNVIKAYDQYKTKNFTILGVSLDGGENAKDKWVQAIAKDGLKWEQVSDLQGWNSGVAKLYKVTAIPANFLLDPNGKIIGRDLRGAELAAKLSEIL